jgi:hypothetical protein
MFRLILLFLLVLFVLLVVAVRYLPWWGVLLLVVGLLVFARFGMRAAVVALFMIPFKAKSAVLRNASAEVHSVTWEPAPERRAHEEPVAHARSAIEYSGSDESANDPEIETESDALAGEDSEVVPDEEEAPRDHYRIDVTITPQPKPGGFQHWEPSELRLMPYTVKLRASLSERDDDAGEAVDVQIFRDGQFAPDEEGKYFGALRLRLLMAVPLDAPRHVKFRYYFELFGDLTLPPSGQTP